MGELGAVSQYYYWSDRMIRQVATDNDLELRSRWRWKLNTPAIPFLPAVEIGQDQRDFKRNEVARAIETAIGLEAVSDFVTPPPIRYAKGIGHIEVARTTVRFASNEGAVIHTTVKSDQGKRVDICLFGSLDNFRRYIRNAEAPQAGWTSSAWYAIEELLRSHGTKNTSQWEDDQAITFEAFKIAVHQGETGHTKEHGGKPSTRGFTIGCGDEIEWFAEIYKDVEIDKHRWHFHEDEVEAQVDRILVGAPIWIRTARSKPLTLYHTRGH